jgi:hypothetical protein
MYLSITTTIDIGKTSLQKNARLSCPLSEPPITGITNLSQYLQFRMYKIHRPERPHSIHFCVQQIFFRITFKHSIRRGRDSSVGIGTRYRLNCPEIESRLEARFSVSVQTGPGGGPSQPPIQREPGLSWGVKRTGSGVDHLPTPPSSADVEGRVEL